MPKWTNLLTCCPPSSGWQPNIGTAVPPDAVSQNLDIIRRYRAQYLVILAGDHIYQMDYSRLLINHVEKGAPCTVACLPIPGAEARDFGVLAVDADYRVVDFVEKPVDPPAMPGQPDMALASMGIYVFDADYLYQRLEEDRRNDRSSHDFSKDILPRVTADGDAADQIYPGSRRPFQCDAEFTGLRRLYFVRDYLETLRAVSACQDPFLLRAGTGGVVA